MGAVLPTTLWIGASVAGIMIFVQLTLALVRRDGQSLGRVLLGHRPVRAGVGRLPRGWRPPWSPPPAGLSRGILQAMLHVDSLSGVRPRAAPGPARSVDDARWPPSSACSSLLLLIPAAFFYLLIMFVREAALIILAATAPISAGGLVSDSGTVWFWKTLRWFISCLLISPDRGAGARHRRQALRRGVIDRATATPPRQAAGWRSSAAS